MTQDEIMKLSNEKLNAKVEELHGNEIVKGYVFESKRIPCPDGDPACLAIHYGLVPRKVTDFAGDIAAAWELVKALPDSRTVTIYPGHMVVLDAREKGSIGPGEELSTWFYTEIARFIGEEDATNITRAYIMAKTGGDK